MPLLSISSSTMSFSTVFFSSVKFSLLGFATFVVVWALRLFVIEPYRSHLSKLPGPKRRGMFGSHIHALLDPDYSPLQHEIFQEKYGLNMRYHGLGYYDERYLTFDPVAINHVLGRAADLFPKPYISAKFASRVVGEGVFVAEGEEHRIQRKIIMPAFSPQALRDLQPVMFGKAAELRDAILSLVPPSETVVQDMNNWMWRTTFDIIGVAGFSHNFNAIRDPTNATFVAFRELIDVGITRGFSAKGILELYWPWVAVLFPCERIRTVKRCQQLIKRTTTEIINQRKTSYMLEKGHVGKETKDMLNLLVKANLEDNFAERRLTDDDLLNQITSLLFVGSDSSALGATWVLHHLSKFPLVQERLREEILSCLRDDHADLDHLPSVPSVDIQQAILALPYLDQVVKESLRLIPPVHSTVRVAGEDTHIPTSDGTEVFMRKGQFVHIAFEGFNLRKDVWGPDAHSFNPDRWSNLPPLAKEGPGVAHNFMTFSLGPHSCPGHQFAFLETKAIIATLIPHIVFQQGDDVKMFNAMLTRPFVRVNKERVISLPLRLSRYSKSQ